MSKRKHEEKSLLSQYKLFIIIPAAIVAFIVVLAVILIIVYAFTEARIALIVLIIIAVLTLAVYGVLSFSFVKGMHSVFYDQMFSVTYDNINRIRNNNTDLESYKSTNIKEIKMLDEATRQIEEKLNSSYLMVTSPDYSSLSLEYVHKDQNLITYKSFKNNIANIIFLSQSFRNVVIEIYYNLPRSYSFSIKDKTRLLDLYSEAFKAHDKTLYMFGEDDKSLIIYLPVIDSFTEIREKLEGVITNSSVMVRDERGIRNVPAQYALVAYPYSTENMILGDLKYARRQNRPYFLFLPKRFQENIAGNQLLTNTTMNLNYMAKIISELSSMDYSSTDNEENIKILINVFNSMCNYLGVDEGGIIAFDKSSEKYYSYVKNTTSTLFERSVPTEFVDALVQTVDEDQSYYFSNRMHANREVGRQLDLYGVTSGTYYVVKGLENKNITALVYLFNLGKDFKINSYLRETFYMMSLRIENYFEKKDIVDYANQLDEENEHLLALSDYYSYRVDEDYRIVKYSANMKKIIKKIALGDYCYKVFYGIEHPCSSCPLKTFKRRYVSLKTGHFEVSTILNDRKTVEKNILVRRVDEGYEADLFQKNFLVYSYHSLFESLKNEYISSGRGFVTLLKIDNYDKLVEQKGGEAYELIVRNLVRNIKNKLKIDDIYFYNPSTIALHFPYVGHADIINRIETIYPLTKEDVIDDQIDDSLDVTYLVTGYPRGYATVEDFLKHVSDFYHSNYEQNKDFIYFSDYSITRSASKRDFMISVLKSEFGSQNSTSMNLQPIVRVKDGHIFGAEILIRIADEHRNVFFNANEISSLAEQEKMTYLITDSIINFVGNMYKEYGNNVFKINKFNRIAINIDQTYLDDASLVKQMVNLCKTNNLPNDFISLEIPEDMIPHNIDGIKALAKELSAYKIMFSCDRYLGEYVDIGQLKDLGFAEVKIARDIISKIDRDPVVYQELSDIVTGAKSANMRVAAVGVENEAQFTLLKGLDEDMMVQGYYLYRPLTRSDLISALISYEKQWN